MDKLSSLFIVLFLGAAVSVPAASAQLIDWSKRHARDSGPSNPVKKSPVVASPLPENHQPVVVKTREDHLFDSDNDGLLQTNEIREMLKNLTEEVATKGKCGVRSDVIKPYDKNGDGAIDRKEVMAVTRELQK